MLFFGKAPSHARMSTQNRNSFFVTTGWGAALPSLVFAQLL